MKDRPRPSEAGFTINHVPVMDKGYGSTFADELFAKDDLPTLQSLAKQTIGENMSLQESEDAQNNLRFFIKTAKKEKGTWEQLKKDNEMDYIMNHMVSQLTDYAYYLNEKLLTAKPTQE